MAKSVELLTFSYWKKKIWKHNYKIGVFFL